MNTRDVSKFKQISKDAGFLPDGDVLEMGEKVVEEGIKALKAKGMTAAARALEEHFYPVAAAPGKKLSVRELINANGLTTEQTST